MATSRGHREPPHHEGAFEHVDVIGYHMRADAKGTSQIGSIEKVSMDVREPGADPPPASMTASSTTFLVEGTRHGRTEHAPIWHARKLD